jgi:tetratricopeptide (TPR) repeat protein
MTTPHWDRVLSRALVARSAEGASGILKLTRGKLRRLFCLEGGTIVHVASNVLEEQIGEFLVRRGTLDPVRREAAEIAAKAAQAKVGKVLVEQGALPEADLVAGIEALAEELFASALDWSDGALEFTNGLPRLDGEITVQIAPVPLVLRYARTRPFPLNTLRMRIGPPDTRLEVVATSPLASSLELDATGQHVLGICGGSSSLPDIVRLSPSDEESTLRSTYGLLLLGVLDPAVKRSKAGDGRASDPALTREECLARLAIGEGRDHYMILGIDRGAARTDVREAYYALARRYHPDRFRSGGLRDLLPRFEAFFTLVTDAYNTLSSPERRSEYDQQLAALVREPAPTRESDTVRLARENYLRAKVLLQRGRHVEASTFLENAVKLDDTQAEYHMELGIQLVRNVRRREDAEHHLKKAIALAPASVQAYLALGQLYHRQERFEDAGRLIKEVLRWEPQNVEAKALLAEIVARKEKSGEGGILRGLFRG